MPVEVIDDQVLLLRLNFSRKKRLIGEALKATGAGVTHRVRLDNRQI